MVTIYGIQTKLNIDEQGLVSRSFTESQYSMDRLLHQYQKKLKGLTKNEYRYQGSGKPGLKDSWVHSKKKLDEFNSNSCGGIN